MWGWSVRFWGESIGQQEKGSEAEPRHRDGASAKEPTEEGVAAGGREALTRENSCFMLFTCRMLPAYLILS